MENKLQPLWLCNNNCKKVGYGNPRKYCCYFLILYSLTGET